MLRAMPGAVNLPFQSLVDDGLLDAERLTLAICYAYADEFGIVCETPTTLESPRALHRNSVRRHLYKLEKLRYLVPIHKANRLELVPQRRTAEGYALTLRPDGGRFPAAHPTQRIGSKGWDARKRWA